MQFNAARMKVLRVNNPLLLVVLLPFALAAFAFLGIVLVGGGIFARLAGARSVPRQPLQTRVSGGGSGDIEAEYRRLPS